MTSIPELLTISLIFPFNSVFSEEVELCPWELLSLKWSEILSESWFKSLEALPLLMIAEEIGVLPTCVDELSSLLSLTWLLVSLPEFKLEFRLVSVPATLSFVAFS